MTMPYLKYFLFFSMITHINIIKLGTIMKMNTKEFKGIREKCIQETKNKIRESVNEDAIIIQTISLIEELDKVINQLVVRVREWYELYNPEGSRALTDNEKFIEVALLKDKKTLLKEINVENSMGKDLATDDLNAIMEAARKANELIKLRETEKKYLEKILHKYCPNTVEVLGESLTAKILRHAGSLRKLAMTRSTVIQIMGAEKALFRHLTTKSRSPKYGILFAHTLVNTAARKNKGKIARTVADKAAIAAKVDFFKGEFIGKKLKEDIDKKVKSLK
jgi:nucleolar protein 56